MKTSYSVEQIGNFIFQSADTKLRHPYSDDVLLRSSKIIIQSLQENEDSGPAFHTACKDALSYFASEVTDRDIETLVTHLKNELLPQI